MTQDERRRFLLAALLRERTPSRAPALPPDADGQRLLLRALLNLRPPGACRTDVFAGAGRVFAGGAAAQGYHRRRRPGARSARGCTSGGAT